MLLCVPANFLTGASCEVFSLSCHEMLTPIGP